MSLKDQLIIDVRVSRPSAKALIPKRNSKNTGVYQSLGMLSATIKLKDESVLFDNLRGFIGLSKLDNRKEATIVVNYDNAPQAQNDGDRTFPTSHPSDELGALLKVESINALNRDGYAASNYDKEVAENAGIEVSELTEMSKACIDLAAKFADEASAEVAKETQSNSTTGAVSDEQMGQDMESASEEA